jgi:16S rRNA A1518/A1519 N6-dimethyltransferase RsmA/KsgA/DIM1 with predicted DNA glycosylase/AP lyase activity
LCFRADTSVGQHILKNPLIVDNMITKVKENILQLTLLSFQAELKASDTVLEIGPGERIALLSKS